MTRDVLMSVNGDDKELQELKIFKDGVTVEEYRLLEDDELKVNGIAEEVKVGQGGTVEAPAVQHIPQQQPQGSIACWERFLHLRSLKVLLVENDDSTRHVVTALLRNCSYEVIEAANGLQAWKMLEDLTNHIDLILTEVAMPCFSGIGLLCKIMSHQMRKNIPVIMMSSHDSMGIVFKCLSKGAVDFLVKPIRKNELKNLWQHVWRRCHSSSGSGSESDTQTQKSVKSKSTEKSDSNTGSNDEDDNGSVGLNNGDEGDNVSGTQSSWTKQAVEVDSPKQVPQCDQMAEYPDSTCAQFDHSNAEKSGNKMIPIATRDCPEEKEQLGAKHSIPLDVGLSKFNDQISRGQLDLNCENPSGNLRCKGPSAPDAITSTSDSQMQGGEVEAPNRRPNPSDIENKATNNIEELPSLDLSLKRLRGVKDAGTKTKDERNVIRRSDLSAFSRYNASSSRKKSPTGCVGIGSNFPHDNSLVLTKKVLSREIQSHSSGNPPSLYSNGPCNNIDMGSTTNNAFTKTAVISEPAMRGTHNDSPTQDLQHHFEHHNSIANNMQHQLPPDHDNSTLKTMATAAPHCGLSNAEVLVEGTIQNYSVNRSASCSNNGSKGESGNSSAVNARGKNLESDNGIAGNSGSGDASGSGSENINRVDQNKTSQRAAALNKFRQKRKERCFRKKVRYQSRKNLAEQRPRFRGQFVRQPSNGNASEATGS